MSLHDRTKKRLRWLVIIVVIVGVVGAGGYFLRKRQIERATLVDRARGLQELAAGDYFQALNDIGRYVQRHPRDADTLYSYAQARQQVPEPDGRHIREAMSLYRQVLTLEPRNFLAADELLKLYGQYHMSSEALALSKEVLAGDPANREALKAQAMALYSLGSAAPASSDGAPLSGATTRQSRDQAMRAATQYNDRWPTDLEGQMLTLEILSHTDAGWQGMAAHVQKLLDRSPDDPHFQLLMGYVDLLPGGDRVQAKGWLDKASRGVLPDLSSLQLLVRCCDSLDLFDQSFAAISRQAAQSTDPQARRLLAGRLWETEQYADLVSQFKADVIDDGQVAALRCLALEQLGRRDEAKAASTALSNAAAKNPIAQPWASIVKAMVAGDKSDDAALITASEKALNEVENPYIRMLMGDAYMRIGDADTAMEAWERVYREPPAIGTLAWAAPRMRLADAALAVGHFDDAATLAQQALDRLPGNVQATMLLANALAMKIDRHDPASANKVLALLDQLDKTPQPPPGAGPLRVQVLASVGRKDDALASAERILSAKAQPSAGELLQLASISRSLKLGIEQRCARRCEQLHGMSPDLALWNISALVETGGKAHAVDQFDALRNQAGAQGSQQAWEVARARVLELVGDGRAKAGWESLADSYPDEAQIQWQAIGAPSVQSDRSFIRRVLDRLRGQFGGDGLRWRLTQARWLLSDTSNSQDAAEAALMLKDLTTSAPNMVLPRLMLADTLVRLGNYSGAIDQLSDAVTRQPQSAAIALKLAALLQSRGDSVRARTYLDRVTSNPSARPAELRQAAEMLDQQGDAAGALAAVSRAYGDAINAPPPDLLLATIYRKTGQMDRAEQVLKRLLEKPSAANLEFAADFYASIGRKADAEAALKQLDKVPTAPGEKELVRGVYAMRTGKPDQAQTLFESATRLAPQNPQAWRQLIRIDLANHDDAKAGSAAQAALVALPKDQGLIAYCRNSEVASRLKVHWPEFEPFLAELLTDPQEEQAFTSAAELVGKAVPRPATHPAAGAAPSNAAPAPLVLPPTALNDLRTLAGNHARNFPLQVLAARACLLAGDTDSAGEIAQRAVSMRSGDALSMTFAANTLLAARQWDDIASLLRPRLKNSAQDRIGWMRLAVMVLPDPAESARWLREVEPLSLKGDFSERLALVQCWQDLADRAHDASAAAHAKELTSDLAAAQTPSSLQPGQALSLGCIQEQQGDLAQAEASYRRAVTMDPKGGIAQNNLAMLLAKQHGRLDEALKLANGAVATGGANRANYYDTLAFVQGQRGDFPAAVAAAKEALALRPSDPQFQIRLANMLLGNHQAQSAKSILEQIQSRPEAKKFPPDLLKQIDSLRQRLEGTASAG